ncbi:hypothetical protein [Candidatus Liberibacter americanus]|uniref:hypothetical protein n=1 Tax=Candidatus Liberibacter americanus TaxID=309868 RepID=UPI0016512C95|nr:hypothetical protein [Candidatus Liberibacter americanus]
MAYRMSRRPFNRRFSTYRRPYYGSRSYGRSNFRTYYPNRASGYRRFNNYKHYQCQQ